MVKQAGCVAGGGAFGTLALVVVYSSQGQLEQLRAALSVRSVVALQFGFASAFGLIEHQPVL